MIFRAWAKHAALNFGQVVRDFRYFYYHPDVDKIATEGTLRHGLLSFGRRIYSLGNNIVFTLLPPQLHHSPTELRAMLAGSYAAWFLRGYKPWSYAAPKA